MFSWGNEIRVLLFLLELAEALLMSLAEPFPLPLSFARQKSFFIILICLFVKWMQTFFKAQTTKRIDRFKSIIFLQKIGYSRSCVVSVYFNNRQSLEPNEIETGTVLLSLSLSDSSYENFEHFLFSWSLSVLYTHCSLLSLSTYLWLTIIWTLQ